MAGTVDLRSIPIKKECPHCGKKTVACQHIRHVMHCDKNPDGPTPLDHITLAVPKKLLARVDKLVINGECDSRSEFIRLAMHSYINFLRGRE